MDDFQSGEEVRDRSYYGDSFGFLSQPYICARMNTFQNNNDPNMVKSVTGLELDRVV